MSDRECQHLWETLSLGYTESRGHPALREAIARFVTESNDAPEGTITADDVLVFSCAEEAIYTVTRALIRHGDHVACVWPAYQSLYQVALDCGAIVHPIPAKYLDGAWDLSEAGIHDATRDQTHLVVANVPHNPTGMVPSDARWLQLCARAKDAGAVFFADEVYRPLFRVGRAVPQSAVIAGDTTTIALGSVSKAFGLAGVRIGWIATREHAILRKLEQYKDYTTICSSAPAEILALIALRNWRTIVAEQQAIIDRNSVLFEQFASRHPQLIETATFAAGSTCFPIWRGIGTAQEMADLAVDRAGIMILSGDLFDPSGAGSDDVNLAQRFRVGLGRKSLPGVLDRFGDHLAATY
jgi:aspartate/methionine/tyrosine aminotransferase